MNKTLNKEGRTSGLRRHFLIIRRLASSDCVSSPAERTVPGGSIFQMIKKDKPRRDPLKGTQVVSTVATGGGGGVFQARVGALYLANMLTGMPTAFGLHGARVETLRFEARYTGAHTDDIYCHPRAEPTSIS